MLKVSLSHEPSRDNPNGIRARRVGELGILADRELRDLIDELDRAYDGLDVVFDAELTDRQRRAISRSAQAMTAAAEYLSHLREGRCG